VESLGKSQRTAKTTKGEQTRTRILEAALALFKEQGYEETTMREVAERADVALGNAYYYFSGKESLLEAYYGTIHREHMARAMPLLEKQRDLKKRLLGVIEAQLEVMEPYHRFSVLLFKTAADPDSPLNPFSAQSAEARAEGIELYAHVLDGAKVKIPRDIAPELPQLLWSYSMGVVLFWLHDRSEGRERTHRMVARTVDLVVRMINLLSNPLLRPVRKSALQVLRDLNFEE
jgi:AcrR family transcriptional regulator